MDTITYNIPAAMAGSYRGRNTIIRCHDPAEPAAHLLPEDLEHLAYIQLFSPASSPDSLLDWEVPVPVDLVLTNPGTTFPMLYHWTELLARQPVRISVPAHTGFSKAVKLAVSLEFPVKLLVDRADRVPGEEMRHVLEFYLHQSTASQPIEYFHSMLAAFYHDHETTLWLIQEEDPAWFRYITDDGREAVGERGAGVPATGADGSSFLEERRAALLATGGECSKCTFLDVCCGYFKWPQETCGCDDLKAVFRTLQEAAAELRKDVAAMFKPRGTERS